MDFDELKRLVREHYPFPIAHAQKKTHKHICNQKDNGMFIMAEPSSAYGRFP
jgi:hypothetical protein